jgi:hypothetical protein
VPRWQAMFTLLIFLGAMAALGAVFLWAGWQFALGTLVGYAFLACMVRIKYGFWPEA